MITTEADGASALHVADIDGDGRRDLLSASFNSDTIAWHRNNTGNTFSVDAITTEANGALSVIAFDFEGDGDMDVFSASLLDDKIAWYRNLTNGVCDNCSDVPNLGQGPAPFGQTVRAISETGFEWAAGVSWERSRGEFVISADLVGYPINEMVGGSGTGEDDLDLPPVGSAYWYLWRPECDAGTYSTGAGTESGDRSVLLP